MAARRGQAPFLSSETLAGVAAVWLLVATLTSFVLDAIPWGPSGQTGFGLSILMLVLGLAPLVWVNLYRAGWRRKQTRLNDDFNAVVAEGRPFMLYLRPFVTSGRIKAPNDWPHFGQRMLLGDPWEMEMALATVIGVDTPLVAVGDTRSGYGAAKLVTSDADWRDHMRKLANDARLILAVPLDRPSTLWEMEEINANDVLREKSVFIMPPSSRFYDLLFFFFRRSIAARWRRSTRVLKQKGITLPRYRHRGGFFLLGHDGQPSKLAGFRHFKPDYVDGMLTELSTVGARAADRIGWFNTTYGGTRWLPPRILGGLSLMGVYTPTMFKRIVLTVAAFFAVSSLVFQLRSVPSEDMAPTLLVGDRVVIAPFAYGYTRTAIPFGFGDVFPDDPRNPEERLLGSSPKRGDVVALQHQHKVYVKRLIGIPGDTVQMRQGRLILNGQVVERTRVRIVTYPAYDGDYSITAAEYREQLPGESAPHLIHEFADDQTFDETPAFTVPPSHVFVMGDNRDNSLDSRAPSGHRTLAQQVPEAWPFAPSVSWPPGENDGMGFVPFDHLLGRLETVLFTLNDCLDAPNAECLRSRVLQRP